MINEYYKSVERFLQHPSMNNDKNNLYYHDYR